MYLCSSCMKSFESEQDLELSYVRNPGSIGVALIFNGNGTINKKKVFDNKTENKDHIYSISIRVNETLLKSPSFSDSNVNWSLHPSALPEVRSKMLEVHAAIEVELGLPMRQLSIQELISKDILPTGGVEANIYDGGIDTKDFQKIGLIFMKALTPIYCLLLLGTAMFKQIIVDKMGDQEENDINSVTNVYGVLLVFG